MKAALLSILGLFLSITIASAQYGGGGGYTTTGGGGSTVTGGTGCNTAGSSMLKGNGSGGCANAAPGTDYAPPTAGTALLKGSGAGGFTPAIGGTDYAPATGSTTSILKGNGIGAFANAVSGTDYPPVPSANCGQDATHGCGYNTTTNTWSNQSITGTTTPASTNGAIQYNNSGVLGGVPITGIVKGNGTAAPGAAAAGTDYLAPPAGTALQKANSGGALANAVAGTDYQAALTSGAPASATIGGSGVSNPTPHSVMLGEGASPMTPLSLALDAMLIGAGAAADPVATLINGGASCGDPSHAISYSTTTHSFGCQALTIAAAPGGGPGALQYNNAGVLGGTSVTGIVKGNGSLAPSAAVSGTDYAPATPSGTAILKGNNAGGFNSAAAGTDYQSPIGIQAPVASNFLTGFNGVGFSFTRPLSTDLGDLPVPITSGGTASTTAAGALTGLGGLAINNNLSEIAAGGTLAQGTAQGNLGLSTLATLPSPLDTAHGGLNTATPPATAQIPIGNSGGFGYTAQTITGDGSVNSAGVLNIGSTHISGASPSALAQFNSQGNIVPYTGSGTLAPNNFATALSGAGALTGSQVSCGGLTGAAAHCGTNASELSSGTVAAAQGGAGSTNGILKANGTGAVSAAVPSIDYAPATSGAAGLPLFNNGIGGFTTGTLSGTGTNLATFSGPATSARCLHTDASGNVTITGTDCTAGTGGIPGYVNTPTVSASGGNSTVTLLAQCSLAGCTDYNNVANGSNAGTLTMTPPPSTGMISGGLFWIYVKVGATAPSDIFFGAAPSGVTYQSYVLGLLASDLTSTAAGEAAKRAASCGTPTANGVIAYQAWWDGTNLNVTNCGSSTAAPYLGVALGGTQCGPAGPIATTLPAVPSTGARCMVTNASACVAGTALNTGVTGTTACEVVWNGTSWQPAGGAIAPAAGGFTTAGLGLTSSGASVALATPVAATNGGAGTINGVLRANGSGTVSAAVPNTDFQAPLPSATPAANLYLTGFTAPSTFTTRRPASTDLSDLPIPVSSGGSGCLQSPSLVYNGLQGQPGGPTGTPAFGQSCFITDCASGIAGTPEVGGGSISCAVAWMGASCPTAPHCWIDGGIAQAAAGSGTGVSIQLTNNSTSGTVTSKLASVNTLNHGVITPAGATAGIQGVCISGCGTSGTATIQTQGSVPVYFDGVSNPGNNITPGDYAAIDTTVGGQAGEAYDVGTMPPGGIALIGTIMSPTPGTPCSNASCGPYNVNLFGPDVTGAAGSNSINAGVIGNPGIYSGSNTISPMSGVISIHPYLASNPSDPLHAAQKACPGNGACVLKGSPGDIYPLPSPLWLGMGLTNTTGCPSACKFIGPNGLNQTLELNGSTINASDSTREGSPTQFQVDDGIIIGGRSRIYCYHGESADAPSHISATSTAWLNSLITSPTGVILNSWEPTHPYLLGQVIYDGSNTEYVSTAGTSGGTTPVWPTSQGATKLDGTVTWTQIVNNSQNPAWPGRPTGGGQQFMIEGCNTGGNLNTTAHINNIIRAGGVQGGIITIRDTGVAALGSEPNGSDGVTGSTGILIDSGQTDGFCTGLNQPLACCGGGSTGSCHNGTAPVNNTCCGTIDGTFLAPGFPANPVGPYAGLYLNGVTNIKVSSSQWADLSGTGVVALALVSGSRAIEFDNNYFETGSGNLHQMPSTSSALLLNNVHSFNETNDFYGINQTAKIGSCAHIQGASSFHIHLQGDGINNPCVNQVQNDLQPGDTLAGTAFGPAFDYVFSNLANAANEPMTFNGLQLSYYMTTSHCIGAGNPISCCSGPNAGSCTSVPTPFVASDAHVFICTADADACTTNTPYSNTGAHNILCLLQGNSAGTAWQETGTRCQ